MFLSYSVIDSNYKFNASFSDFPQTRKSDYDTGLSQLVKCKEMA